MKIQALFDRDITRPINGVVKADQLDATSVWQELDEFVVTRELTKHFRAFFTRYAESLSHHAGPAASEYMGVWVSGFFGSGKSHFIKVLSYLLENHEHSHDGARQRAVDFFDGKIADAMLLGDIKRAAAVNTDVILFNIDSKAPANASRDAMLSVFLKVLNERQGYSGDHAHVAHMERHLDSIDKLDTFHRAYRDATGEDWLEQRDVYEFNRDEVIQALMVALGQSQESCARWIDNAEDNFPLSVENFAKWTRDYLDARGPDHRLLFLVDEVGQFIGTDRPLMLNLQTITEMLGTVCQGRAWVVVTSQEDIDAVLGEIKKSKANDFSKIQGRFKTRLSLSSANVDEVIQKRLLDKTDEARAHLAQVFAETGDILKNQLTFADVGMTFKKYRHADDFVRDYPFAPYQFHLLQKIFESIRKAGATGLHLAQGERSLLEAFQSAARSIADQDVGALVPLYRFYPSIQSFLDTAVKRTIDKARDNDSLQPFDAIILQVLFLIRYVEELRGNVDNLVTLCIDRIDADRLALRHDIEASLVRLENETLISRNGDTYTFLTNEERDIGREIKSVELTSGDEARLLGVLIYRDIFNEDRKHRYARNKMDFPFNRLCDGQHHGNRTDGDLLVSVITPLGEDYAMYNQARCTLESQQDDGRVLIWLGDHSNLDRELRTHLKTDKYLRTRGTANRPASTEAIHRDLAAQNRDRRDRLKRTLSQLLVEARYFVLGPELKPTGKDPQANLAQALDYLIGNSFGKMALLETLLDDPRKETLAVLRMDDVSQLTLAMDQPQSNPRALDELRSYLQLATGASRQVVLHELIGRYRKRPYGWPPAEVALLLARLLVAAEVRLVKDGAAVARDDAFELFDRPSRWRSVRVLLRKQTPVATLRKARQLGKELFAAMGPDAEEPLFEFLAEHLGRWQTELSRYKDIGAAAGYPGQDDIGEGLALVKALTAPDDAHTFLQRFVEQSAALLDFVEAYHDVRNFYGTQLPVWKALWSARDQFELNRMHLERHDDARAAMRRIHEILGARAPYGLLKEADGLIARVRAANDELVGSQRSASLAVVDAALADARAAADAATHPGTDDAAVIDGWLAPLHTLRREIVEHASIAHLMMHEKEAQARLDQIVGRIVEHVARRDGPAPRPVLPIQVVQPAALTRDAYLTSERDVDDFLDQLRTALMDAIAAGKRVRIR